MASSQDHQADGESHHHDDSESSPTVATQDVVAEFSDEQRVELKEEAHRERSQHGLTHFATAVLVLGGTALTLGLLTQFQAIIGPVFLAINLLVVVYPLYRMMVRHGAPILLSSLLSGLVVFLLLIALVLSLVWSGSAMVQALVGYQDQFTELYRTSLDALERIGFDQSNIMDQLRSISPSNVIGALSGVVASFSSASGILLVMLLTLVFMVMDMGKIHHRIAITNRLHPDFVDAISSLVIGVRRYWVVTTVFGLIVAAMDYVALLVVGVPMSLVWAVLAFVTNYIPNVGFFIGLLPPALLTLMEDGWISALIIVIAFSVINFIMQSIIQPKVAGDAIGISPVVSLISLLVWAAVFGALGALLALPLTLVVKALLIDNDPRARWVNALISANPIPETVTQKDSAAA